MTSFSATDFKPRHDLSDRVNGGVGKRSRIIPDPPGEAFRPGRLAAEDAAAVRRIGDEADVELRQITKIRSLDASGGKRFQRRCNLASIILNLKVI